MGKGVERIVEIKPIARGIDTWLQTLLRRLIPPRLAGVPERLVLNPTVCTSATDGDTSWSLLLEVLEERGSPPVSPSCGATVGIQHLENGWNSGPKLKRRGFLSLQLATYIVSEVPV